MLKGIKIKKKNDVEKNQGILWNEKLNHLLIYYFIFNKIK